jgi:hypothetical protein
MRRAVAALALGASLAVFAAPAAADVRAFRTSDGGEDPAFVRLGARTRVDRVVPDGSRGVYLVGRIVVDGGARQIVHLKPSGAVDRGFRPQIRGGRVAAAAAHGGEVALIGTFTSVDGLARARVAVLDARTGKPLPWKPQLPISASLYGLGEVVLAGRTLVVGTDGGLFAWRRGSARTAWTRGYQFALIASWRAALWAVVATAEHGARLASIDPATGRTRVRGQNVDHVEALLTIGGRLMALSRGTYRRVDHPGDKRLASCAQANGNVLAVALAGDARTLYVGDSPSTSDEPGSVPGVSACPWSGGSTPFRAPAFGYGPHGPLVSGLALVGTHVLVFTRRV